MRGYHEHLEESGDTDMARLREAKTMEETYLKNADTGHHGGPADRRIPHVRYG